ncbi:MAG: type II secretion system protein [Planctomycetota bacterium]
MRLCNFLTRRVSEDERKFRYSSLTRRVAKGTPDQMNQTRCLVFDSMSRKPARLGFSLLEMLLALAILGTALGVLAQIASTGTDAAREARDLNQARLIAQAKMAEILIEARSGISPQAMPLTDVDVMDSQADSQFLSQIDVAPAAMDGMLAIRVSIQSVDANGNVIATYGLNRWLIDPLLGLADIAAEEAALRDEEASL